MNDRRAFLSHLSKVGLAAATSALWGSVAGRRAFAQISATTYKAILVITLGGGNDGNNVLIPLDSKEYAEYSALRLGLALPAGVCLPLTTGSDAASYGLHPTLSNVAALFAQKRAAVVANIGPLAQPATKLQLLANRTLLPGSLQGHPEGQQQWESATTVSYPSSGWGGRIADLTSGLSGSLPLVLNTAQNSIFCAGATVQGIAVQSGGAYPALPPGMNEAILTIAKGDSASTNEYVSAVASFRVQATLQQVILSKAMTYASVSQVFTGSALGKSLNTIAQLLAGRSVVGASRQIFYTQQLGYDTHQNQLGLQSALLSDLDKNLGAFFAALDSLGLSDQVLVCTHSDFNRMIISNTSAGSDHAWGNHQLILGGGIRGGRIIGTMPTLELGGPDDLFSTGVWVPTLSVTQMTASIGRWFGLSASQVSQVFPDLANFPDGAVQLS